MRFHLRHIVPFALLSLVGCGAEIPVSEALPAAAEEVGQEQSMLQVSHCPGCLAGVEGAHLEGGFEREQVKGDIYHYIIRMRVGPTAHDVITLHRVVREKSDWRPARSSKSVFMVHGDTWNFRGAFMASTLTDDTKDDSIAVYLARQGVDVWGIDLRWTHVPMGTQDFSFMKDWNLGTHAKDVGTGLAVARQVRWVTGSGGDKMNLLGWSRGAMVSYAYLNAETQVPAWRRHVSGFIPVDMVVKFGPEAEEQRQWACTRAYVADLLLKAGRVEGNLSGPGAGVAIGLVGRGAIESPDDIATPPLPPLPYRQLGVLLGAATFKFLTDDDNDIYPMVPDYHFTAGMPTGLRYVSERRLFDVFSAARPYQSFTEMVEGEQLMCGEKDLPYDDHLSEVKVPVLYVGAGGGYGSYGEYAVRNLLGSEDVTLHEVRRLPDEYRVADYGHMDLFLANDAAEAVWAPIHKWMKEH